MQEITSVNNFHKIRKSVLRLCPIIAKRNIRIPVKQYSQFHPNNILPKVLPTWFHPTSTEKLQQQLQKWNKSNEFYKIVYDMKTKHQNLSLPEAKEYIKAVIQFCENYDLKDPTLLKMNILEKMIENNLFNQFSSNTGLPLEVVIKNLRNKPSVVREITKFGLTALLVIAAVSVMVEGAVSNIPRGLGMGNSKTQVVTDTKTTFKDVKGCDEVIDELKEIVSYLTNPEKFTKLGAKLPKGVLLCGRPGTGKTLLARAIAGEAKVPFLQASGSEFEEMFVGVGARRIRELFAQARKLAPAIVFIDEIDAVGSKRVNKENTSVRMTLNQLLTELDGFDQSSGVVVICATNFPESLDNALTRPGRLDKTVVVPSPDLQGRKEILELYAKNVKLHSSVDLDVLARRTSGMTGADLFNIINLAAIKCSLNNENHISMEALESAFDRVVVGLERRNPMSEEERQLTAYHEAGHALVSLYSDLADPVHKVTIMPRGSSLGITWQIPHKDKYQVKLNELEARLAVLMGGKAAEALMVGEKNVTAGCTSDLKVSTNLAYEMITQYGMGASSTDVPMFIDHPISEETKVKIDAATQTLLNDAYAKAKSIITKHKKELELVAEALMEYETITLDELKLAVKGDKYEIGRRRLQQNLSKN